MNDNPYAWIEESLATIHRADWYRSVQTINSLPGAEVLLSGQEVINFASNDYLGLAADERLQKAAITAIQQFGTGSTGSRLLSGHRELHRDLEQEIASTKQTQDAVVFSSGYLANIGAITALVGKRDLILSDQYNHSSLKNGAILSGATILEYPHNSNEVLIEKLHQQRQNHRRCLLITDSVFSMDGDLCPLPELLDIAEEFNCMLLLDEAHATGVMGKTGAGCVEHFGCTGRELIQIGTLSKALGSLGGYVAGSNTLIDFLRNRAPSWIYTTALSPADTAAALAAIKIVQQEPQRREQLWRNINYLKQLISDNLPNLNLNILPSESPILCFQLSDAATALKAGKHLKEAGIFAPAIRPPTVPTSRIRITMMATHKKQHIEKLVEVLQGLIKAC
ncbi:8-amino-7-oxononanoate synthase [Anabaena cylindrica FACHB-243]|uniref:8-amino-7-ketopelargonate synthase n=1 Tax=Anabaena cylindrica (strain ATCC 27899 / PCC 7122) TaxID=272123 RepID=K9ZKN3_ANACC|nr:MULTISPECIES: 8-amino-7-oxononanoate synthase [Anabaena]AFZ59793.1 8-amino-7-oxononanoate synthase [Anabaena cylindrica PCC 7122]MBD2417195.1 8-amino-7-oxononanoate synthase [Anabaena cylindrica FACHB-243]MBY5282279.1 8-amino-7-oxononanoate synthase [Anabaena sp. CCAP 1446/1C]MBY5309795.1 8-amino-7-oxononanoate synthase [Anabaena sp. CCAP 1446/1C]MCM2404989.1 8-amino-7-oxononanoate synthase [Anabaena sp. CCAP 1446/1C]